MTYRTLQIIPLLTLVFFISGCGRPEKKDDNVEVKIPDTIETTLVYGRPTDATSLDPANTTDGESVKVIVNVYDTLVGFDDVTSDLAPGLAEKWEESEDRLTWTFHLRKGVKFHDGTPFNADAVVFTFKRVFKGDFEHKYGATSPYASNFNMVKEVKKVDDFTVDFILETPNAVLLRNLSIFAASIVSPTAVKKHKEKFVSNPVGTGPFVFSEWDQGQKVVLDANLDHWRGRPGVDRVIFKKVEESSSRVNQLRKGEIHLADELSIKARQDIKEDKDLRLLSTAGLNVSYVSFNTSKKPFDNPKVRQALSKAINKDAIYKTAFQSTGEIAVNPVPKAMWGHANDLKGPTYNLEQAKKELEAANFPFDQEFSFYVMSAPRPYMPDPKLVGEIISEDFRSIGVKLTIKSPPWAEYLDLTHKGEHDICILGWNTDNADPDNFLFDLLDKDNAIPPKANNVSFYMSEDYHKLIMAGKQETDPDKRAEIYHQAQELVLNDSPMVPLIHLDLAAGARPEVDGYLIHPTGNIFLRNAKIKQDASK